MRVAIIDMGTNTFNLLIQDLESNTLVFKDKLSVKLGEGGLNKGFINQSAFARGIDALKSHQKTIAEYNVEATYAFATSAVRDAKNQTEFVQTCAREANIVVNVISGKVEAELIYRGVRRALPLGNEKVLIVDIGGGSTECIIADAHQTYWLKSHNLGSSRLKERFEPTDPLSEEDIVNINLHLSEELSELLHAVKIYQPQVMIGSSGSFDTMASMIFERFKHPNILLEGATAFDFDMKEYGAMSEAMRYSTVEERLDTPGMLPMRADLMPMATLLIDFLLNQTKITNLKGSVYALKEGVGELLLNKQHIWQKS